MPLNSARRFRCGATFALPLFAVILAGSTITLCSDLHSTSKATQQVKHELDRAALTAALWLPEGSETAESRARATFAPSLPHALHNTQELSIEFGTWNEESFAPVMDGEKPTAVRMRYRRKHPTVWGLTSEVSGTSVATFQKRRIAVLMDTDAHIAPELFKALADPQDELKIFPRQNSLRGGFNEAATWLQQNAESFSLLVVVSDRTDGPGESESLAAIHGKHIPVVVVERNEGDSESYWSEIVQATHGLHFAITDDSKNSHQLAEVLRQISRTHPLQLVR